MMLTLDHHIISRSSSCRPISGLSGAVLLSLTGEGARCPATLLRINPLTPADLFGRPVCLSALAVNGKLTLNFVRTAYLSKSMTSRLPSSNTVALFLRWLARRAPLRLLLAVVRCSVILLLPSRLVSLGRQMLVCFHPPTTRAPVAVAGRCSYCTFILLPVLISYM